jgi:hypothetical protein
MKKQRKQIAKSKGGAIVIGNSRQAVELAATVKEAQGSAYRVTLACPSSRLVQEMSEVDSQKLLAQLTARNVMVKLNCSSGYADAAAYDACVLDCTLPKRPNTEFLQETMCLDGDGFVKCDEKLRVEGGNNVVFCVGDLLSGGARKGNIFVFFVCFHFVKMYLQEM